MLPLVPIGNCVCCIDPPPSTPGLNLKPLIQWFHPGMHIIINWRNIRETHMTEFSISLGGSRCVVFNTCSVILVSSPAWASLLSTLRCAPVHSAHTKEISPSYAWYYSVLKSRGSPTAISIRITG